MTAVDTLLLNSRCVPTHARTRGVGRKGFVAGITVCGHEIALYIDLKGRVCTGPEPGYCSTIAM